MLLKDIFFNIIKVKYLRKIDDDVFVGLSFGNLIIVKTKNRKLIKKKRLRK